MTKPAISTATVTNKKGDTFTFTIPADNTDLTIRYELPDGTKGAYENPNGQAVAVVDGDGGASTDTDAAG